MSNRIIVAQRSRGLARFAAALLLALVASAVVRAQDDPAAVDDSDRFHSSVEWAESAPAFIQDVEFTRDPSSAQGIPEPDTAAEDLWLLVLIGDGAPAGLVLCVHWPAPEGAARSEDCQTLREDDERLTYKARGMSADVTIGRGSASTAVASVTYVTGPAAVPPPPPPPPPPAPVTEPAAPPPRPAVGGGNPGRASQRLPQFPWPPPKPTSRAPLERNLLARRSGATLGTVASHLEAALSRVGYSERSYYVVPGGFALATRLEQITPEGAPRPEPQRWSTALPPQPVFSLGDYLRALFNAPQGDYRVIVFIVTNASFGTTGTAPSQAETQEWLTGGMDRLPPALRTVPFDADFTGSALVYQFRKTGHADAPIANPDGAASAASQLDRSGIVAALRR